MKTLKKTRILLLLVIATVVIAIAAGIFTPRSSSAVYAAESQPYSFEITKLEITYDVNTDRTIDIEERVTIYYTGYSSTGFYRDLPVNSGDRVYDVDVKQLNANGDETDVEYSVEIEDDFVVLDIGDYTNKTGSTVTYIIRYQYAVTKPADSNALYLNIIGYGSEAPIAESHITINLPNGFNSADLYIGSTAETSNELMNIDGNTITVDISGLEAFEGATVNLYFSSGVLTTRFDIIPYIMVIVGCALIAVLVIIKFLVFPKKSLTPVLTFEPPRGMDPVEVSKLIDNKIESVDVTALIYYWAAKGYLKIDLTDKKDPILIRVHKELPEDTPKHQYVMYNALFMRRDMVKLSELEGNFYQTIERVRKLVNEKYTGLYTRKSVCVSLIFTLLGGLLMALAPVITGMVNISSALFYYPAFLALVPAFIIYGITESYAYSVYKMKGGKKALMIGAIIALSALFTALYVWLVPSALIEVAPKIIVCVVAYIVVVISVTLISRTDEYNAKLNEILGFRKFILYAEKDRLELMLKDDPEFYYKILPYAHALGVSDIWEDKFKALTTVPPKWLIDPTGSLVSFILINTVMRSSLTVLTAGMVARPNIPSSHSVSGHGGHFGGGGGGGHGGGGFRGR